MKQPHNTLLYLISCSLLFALGCQTQKKVNQKEADTSQVSAKTAATNAITENVSTNPDTQKTEPPPTSISLPIGNAVIRFDDMFGAPRLNRDSITKLDALHFTMGMGDIDGTLSEIDIIVESGSIDDIQMKERYCSTIMFNQDGSGGVWTIDSIPVHCTEWIPLEKSTDFTIRTLSMSGSADIYPHSTASDSAIARSHASQKEYVTFFESCSRVEFMVTVGNSSKIIVFDIRPGD